jgi:6-pyruvoyltetrahydropterin/6-carboxytetrahydropterin synthase
MKVGTNWRSFTVGHRIPWHQKCGRMHGHNLRARVEIEGEVDPKTGMVVDFGMLGEALAQVVDPLDHKFLAAKGAVLEDWDGDEQWESGKYYTIDKRYVLPKEDVVVLPLDIVSTENLAKYILEQLVEYSWARDKLVRVQVSENGENIAEVSQYVSNAFTLQSTWTGTLTNTFGVPYMMTIPAPDPSMPINIL